MVQPDRAQDGDVTRDEVRGVPRSAHPHLEDPQPDGLVREPQEGQRGERLEVGHRPDGGVHAFEVGQQALVLLPELLLRHVPVAHGHSFRERSDVRRGEHAGGQPMSAGEGAGGSGGGRLPVRPGDLDRGIGQLRVVEQLRDLPDPVEARAPASTRAAVRRGPEPHPRSARGPPSSAPGRAELVELRRQRGGFLLEGGQAFPLLLHHCGRCLGQESLRRRASSTAEPPPPRPPPSDGRGVPVRRPGRTARPAGSASGRRRPPAWRNRPSRRARPGPPGWTPRPAAGSPVATPRARPGDRRRHGCERPRTPGPEARAPSGTAAPPTRPPQRRRTAPPPPGRDGPGVPRATARSSPTPPPRTAARSPR